MLLIVVPVFGFVLGYGSMLGDFDRASSQKIIWSMITLGIVPLVFAWLLRVKVTQKFAAGGALLYLLLCVWYTSDKIMFRLPASYDQHDRDSLLGLNIVMITTCSLSCLGLLGLLHSSWKKFRSPPPPSPQA